jgi:AraC family transcriptional regulator, transcriptional activator of pobA
MKELFTILKITPELLKTVPQKPQEPHRHDHEELLIISHGNPIHSIDFQKTMIEPPVIIYVAQGKVHNFIPDPETRGWLIRYKSELMPDSKFNFYSNFLDQVRFSLDEGYCINTLDFLCDIMFRETQGEDMNNDVVRHLLGALLARLEADTRKSYLEVQSASHPHVVTFNNFLRILEYNFHRPLGAEFYASKLNMSSRNLNLISRSVFGKSITEIIETRKLAEARSLLLNSGKSISEIGYELGYNEKSYFTRVFRKKTGVTPTAFRERMQTPVS